MQEFLTAVLTFFLQALVLMLVLGAARAEISLGVPAPSYFGSMWAVVLISVLTGIVRESYRSYDR